MPSCTVISAGWPQFFLAGLCSLLKQIRFWVPGKENKSREILSARGEERSWQIESCVQVTSCQPDRACLQRSSNGIPQRPACVGFCPWACIWEPGFTPNRGDCSLNKYSRAQASKIMVLFKTDALEGYLVGNLPTVLIPMMQNIGDSSVGMIPESVIN